MITVPKGDGKENVAEIFGDLMGKSFQWSLKDINSEAEKSPQTTDEIKISNFSHIIFLKTQDKKIKNQRQKEHLKNRIKTQSLQRSTVRFIADFSTETRKALGELDDILKVLNKIFLPTWNSI